MINSVTCLQMTDLKYGEIEQLICFEVYIILTGKCFKPRQPNPRILFLTTIQGDYEVRKHR